MRFGSVCSGIEAASVAWHGLGWSAAWFAEIEAFPSAVLAHHFPRVMNVGDMLNLPHLIRGGFVEAPDILVGGTPCQAFSVAGARNSLDDDRGQLTLAFLEIINAIDEVRLANGHEPVIVVWENVPGVLNTKDNAFGCFLSGLSGTESELCPSGGKWTGSGCVLGSKRSVAWRTLDAQFFGVAQRRRRVFVVSSARSGFDPLEILFEFDGVRRDSPPSRDPREETTERTRRGFAESSFGQFRPTQSDAGTFQRSGGVLGGGSETVVVHGSQDPITSTECAFPLGRNSGQENAVAYSILGNHIGRRPENGGNAVEPGVEISPCLTKTDRHAVAYGIQGSMIGRSDSAGPQGSGVSDDISFTLTRGDRHAVAAFSFDSLSSNSMKSNNPSSGCRRVDLAKTLDCTDPHPSKNQGGHAIVSGSRVRRLTPRECERLQGFPDDWTKIPYRKKSAEECPDGPRYAACGNSMAVPVMRWIGSRIDRHVTIE